MYLQKVYSDCGVFVVVFGEFFSDEVNIHLMVSELTIFTQDMQHYYGRYVSDNDDPPKLKSYFTPQQRDDLYVRDSMLNKKRVMEDLIVINSIEKKLTLEFRGRTDHCEPLFYKMRLA
ncbi:hypothetical protein H5410_034316 [Solanum commersonii]|uniref:Ulp1 protease family, C-terminal catalytic domain containing protein n=1 Tax=Solanum commersonii TaxID=4109 RepID=A0A9J5YRB0_SOLCO|nr:hypothetical protein H5410_034316 [Solanum commersonii]